MGKTIAVCNQKGGTAKTTTIGCLGAALAEAKKKVLLVDFDPQAALTLTCGIDPLSIKQTIYDALLSQELKLASVIIHTEDGPDIAPASLNLAGAEVELLNEIGRETFLKEKLAEVKNGYDFILIDCAPSLGLLTINALVAADEVLIPVQTQYFALRAIQQLLDIIKKVRSRANTGLKIGGFLATMYESNTKHSQEVVEELKSTFGKQVYDVVIKKTVKFPDSVIVSQEDFAKPPQLRSILRFDPKSEAAKAYRKLARKVMV
jgi:chromosome partitioning protein